MKSMTVFKPSSIRQPQKGRVPCLLVAFNYLVLCGNVQ